VQLDDQYFHPDCFFHSDGYGATARQIRHLKALFPVMRALLPD
jgi:hypothetical protein